MPAPIASVLEPFRQTDRTQDRSRCGMRRKKDRWPRQPVIAVNPAKSFRLSPFGRKRLVGTSRKFALTSFVRRHQARPIFIPSCDRHHDPPILSRRDRQHAAHQTQTGFRSDRLHHSGQGGVHESGPVGQGPRRPVHYRGCRRQGAHRAGRHGRRGHGRQYRYRADRGRQCDGLQDRYRHSRDAKPGKEGHDAAVGRRTDRGSGRALPQCEQLREGLRAACRAIGKIRSEGCDLGQPVRQCRQSRRPCRHHRPGNPARYRRQDRRLRFGGRHRRHARRRQPRAQRGQQGYQDRRWPIRWARRFTATTRRAK